MNLLKKLMMIIVGIGVVASCGTPSPSVDERLGKVSSADTIPPTVVNDHNAIFLGRKFVSDAAFQAYEFGTADILTMLRSKKIDTLYVNVANVNTCASGCDYADGLFTYSNPSSLLSSFLTSVKAWETANTALPAWKVFAGINGTHGEVYDSGTTLASSTTTHLYDSNPNKGWETNKWVGNRVRAGTPAEWRTVVSNDSNSLTVSPGFSSVPPTYEINHKWLLVATDRDAVRTAVANESKKLTIPSTPGYLGAPTRAFDGVMIDFEPAGLNVPGCPEANGDPRRFDCSKLLLQKVRTTLNPTNSSTAPKVGFTPPRFKNTTDSTNPYRWNYSMFYYGGLYADELSVMAYNMSGAYTTEAAISGYVQTSTKQIGAGLTGEAWNWDASHPLPSRLAKVRIGIGAYESSPPNHDRTTENVRSMSSGLAAGITDMTHGLQGWSALPAMAGGAIYVYVTGAACVNNPSTPYCDPVNVEKFGYMIDTWENWETYWTTPITGW